MVSNGLTGVDDVLDGTHNLFIALSTDPKPEEMVKDLGSRFYVTETAIKTFSVGYPIQSPLDAMLTLRKQHGLTPDKSWSSSRPTRWGLSVRARCPTSTASTSWRSPWSRAPSRSTTATTSR
jgi:hypothetical protein